MKYIITQELLTTLQILPMPRALAEELDELKPIEPMSDELALQVWELLVDNNTDDIVCRFNREISAHIIGEPE